jgi:hypothetical protein
MTPRSARLRTSPRSRQRNHRKPASQDRGGRVSLLNGALAEGAHSLGLGSSTCGPQSDARGRRGGGVPATSQSNKDSPNGFICATARPAWTEVRRSD